MVIKNTSIVTMIIKIHEYSYHGNQEYKYSYHCNQCTHKVTMVIKSTQV